MPASQFSHDFTTPQGAILVLEDAYRARDVDAAVRAKDFGKEAELMLRKLRPEFGGDAELISQTAATLEAAYRASIRDEGFPEMEGTESSFSDSEPHSNAVVVVTEVVRWPDGSTSRQRLLVTETPTGWRVLNALP